MSFLAQYFIRVSKQNMSAILTPERVTQKHMDLSGHVPRHRTLHSSVLFKPKLKKFSCPVIKRISIQFYFGLALIGKLVFLLLLLYSLHKLLKYIHSILLHTDAY